jgi:hypothetical protein
MIIEPDFLDHWKTRLLMRLLDTDAAPNYVIRLWSHCQTRKTNTFPDWSPVILSSVCRWPGDADLFWSAMLQTFCRIEDGHLVAHQWDEVNAGLIASWSNGGKGGRPKKTTGNPQKTHGLPTGYPQVNPEPNQVNPQVTHGVTDREDREDREEKTEKTQADKPPRVRFQKPTVEELTAEAIKIGLPLSEVDKFFNYYESNGWKVGKNSMKSWTATMKTWLSRIGEAPGLVGCKGATSPEVDWRKSV